MIDLTRIIKPPPPTYKVLTPLFACERDPSWIQFVGKRKADAIDRKTFFRRHLSLALRTLS